MKAVKASPPTDVDTKDFIVVQNCAQERECPFPDEQLGRGQPLSRLGWIVVVAVVFMMNMPMSAQERQPVDVSSLGPQVGEKVPDFALPDQHGTIQTLDSIMGERGAMLVFHRSADW